MILLWLVISPFVALAQDRNAAFHVKGNVMAEVSLNDQINVTNHLKDALPDSVRHDLPSSLFLTVGIGYETTYRRWSLATIGRYGINLFRLNQHYLDWNIARICYAFPVGKAGVFIRPNVGLGVVYYPVFLELSDNTAYTIPDLSRVPNSIKVKSGWMYYSLGAEVQLRRGNNNKPASIGLSYDFSVDLNSWKNGTYILQDVKRSRFNAVKLSFSFYL